ncbi:MAG: hypothetical protein R2755_16235 [Acidimicrobiales bacterium]
MADRTVGRLGPDRLAPVGGGLVAAGVAVQVLLLVGDLPLPLGLLGVPLASLGMGMAFTPLAMLVLDQHEQANTGVASSWMSLFGLLGFAFGPAVGGSLVAANPEQPRAGRGARGGVPGGCAGGGEHAVAAPSAAPPGAPAIA